jgi:hypothetical protein
MLRGSRTRASFEQCLADEAARLRKEARGVPPGVEREQLLRRARQADTASHINGWLGSRESQAPK